MRRLNRRRTERLRTNEAPSDGAVVVFVVARLISFLFWCYCWWRRMVVSSMAWMVLSSMAWMVVSSMAWMVVFDVVVVVVVLVVVVVKHVVLKWLCRLDLSLDYYV